MTEREFDIIDELYFVTSFRQLADALNLPLEELSAGLQALARQGYIKCFYPDPDTEVEYNPVNFNQQCAQYYYLATKKGLMIHNSR
ncbi:hypothetical protein [Adhaeribacter pallidiroseus]|uniref:MarR family transcriptional regulator n=1 Tax=Adhaeribacter pallidiroseus TaxID=2072847 RepID=A0A369QKF8_9BACT|nr:hypothetical protein [Adhaeribacter pallidiroseus]RDC63339.1 hypothetical protein AHMF7616_01942 [Adhaeribacter pallidiroseus]